MTQNLSPIKPISKQPIHCDGRSHHKFVRQEKRGATNGGKSWVTAGLKAQAGDICKKCGWTRKDLGLV